MKIINIEQKAFEIAVLMSGFALEILEVFENMNVELGTEVPFCDPEKGYLTLVTERVYYDSGEEVIFVQTEDGRHISWDNFDLAARDILINELHHKYKSEMIYRNFSGEGQEIH